MGAGLSGLVCALTLEKNGITPTIFEKKAKVGERFLNGEILLSFLNRPVTDSIAYFADVYGIYLQPISHIKNLILRSERQKAIITGNLGFANFRGDHVNSFEQQLVRQVNSHVVYNSKQTYEQLLQDYTHVVLATGDARYAIEMQNYRKDFTTKLNGYRVAGNFDRHTIMAWLNNQLAPYGYGYLIPLSPKEADIVLWYPEYGDNNRQSTPDFLINQFYQQVGKDLGQELTIIKRFEIHGYTLGICESPRIGNTYFIGNCFGAVTPYLGFGQYISILTGIYAAFDISGKGNYQELIQPLRQNYLNSLILRRAWEQLDNRGFDRMVKIFGSWMGNRLFNTKHIDVVNLASYLARPWIRKRAYN